MRLIHSRTPAEEAAVLLDGNAPVLFRLDEASDLPVGAVCLASVSAPDFVNVGGVSAYLQDCGACCGADGQRSGKRPCEGGLLIVQVVRAPSEDKNAKVSARAALPSLYFVYTPADTGVSVSRKIPEPERTRLKEMFSAAEDSFTVRTAAQGVEESVLKADLEGLRSLWKQVLSRAASRKTGVLLSPPSSVEEILETYAVDEAVSDDPETVAGLKGKYPFIKHSFRNLWETEGLTEVLEEALSRTVALPSGGSLIVEETAACVCFDVNAGGSSPAVANAEAAREIPKQVLLKELSGQMIVDFAGKKDKRALFELAETLKKSRAELNVWDVTALGLVEMTRRGGRKSLSEAAGGEEKRRAARIVGTLWFSAVREDVSVFAPQNVLARVRPFLGVLKKRLGAHISLIRSETVRIEGVKDV